MKPYKKFKNFQIRWAEKMGDPNDPYLIRWTLILFGYSMRIHHWIKSDNELHFHDHACDLISIILKGKYYNVVPEDPNDPNPDVSRCRKIEAKKWRPWKAKAKAIHYLEIPPEGAWTLLFQGKPYNKWGFIVDGRKLRPLRYFHKFGKKTHATNKDAVSNVKTIG
jgi:hypothetical protein